jgi:hypothetical protein
MTKLPSRHLLQTYPGSPRGPPPQTLTVVVVPAVAAATLSTNVGSQHPSEPTIPPQTEPSTWCAQRLHGHPPAECTCRTVDPCAPVTEGT